MVTNLNTFLMATLRMAADDPEAAEATLRQALGQWTQRGFHIQHNEWFGAEVQIRMYRGDYKDAWNFLTTRYAPSLARSHLTLASRELRIFFPVDVPAVRLAAAMGATDSRPLCLLGSARGAGGSTARGDGMVEGGKPPIRAWAPATATGRPRLEQRVRSPRR